MSTSNKCHHCMTAVLGNSSQTTPATQQILATNTTLYFQIDVQFQIKMWELARWKKENILGIFCLLGKKRYRSDFFFIFYKQPVCLLGSLEYIVIWNLIQSNCNICFNTQPGIQILNVIQLGIYLGNTTRSLLFYFG